MTQSEWSQGLTLRDRTYGVRHRVRRFRWELADGGRPLLRWFPRRWFVDPLAMVDICSPWEAAWVTRHLATAYSGEGALVELGPWLGDITLGMLRGLEDNPKAPNATIDVYDLFVFEDIEQRTAGLPLEGRFHEGESFLPIYLERLGAGRGRVRAHEGDVLEHTWPTDRPIEFLFNDVAKTWEIWNHLTTTFYRSLPVGATVVEQDWAHACTPWVHLWHHRNREHFETLGQIPISGSVAFRVRSPLPPAAFEPEALGNYTEDQVDDAFDWATTLVDSERQPNVRAAYVQLYTLHGDLDRASRLCVGELAASRISSELHDIALPVLAERLAAASQKPEAQPS